MSKNYIFKIFVKHPLPLTLGTVNWHIFLLLCFFLFAILPQAVDLYHINMKDESSTTTLRA